MTVLATISSLKRDRLRVSIFSLLAEIHICKRIASDTGGEFGVPTNLTHLRDLVLALVPPRPMASGGTAPSNSLIRVGFPRKSEKVGEDAGPNLGFSPGGGTIPTLCDAPYRCPQCDAAQTELPTQCPICQLKLMSSVELTKTYHHLFPVPAFVETALPPAKETSFDDLADIDDNPTPRRGRRDTRDLRTHDGGRCFGCADALQLAAAAKGGTTGFVCPACKRPFCAACDELIHSTLRACPGCEMQIG